MQIILTRLSLCNLSKSLGIKFSPVHTTSMSSIYLERFEECHATQQSCSSSPSIILTSDAQGRGLLSHWSPSQRHVTMEGNSKQPPTNIVDEIPSPQENNTYGYLIMEETTCFFFIFFHFLQSFLCSPNGICLDGYICRNYGKVFSRNPFFLFAFSMIFYWTSIYLKRPFGFPFVRN